MRRLNFLRLVIALVIGLLSLPQGQVANAANGVAIQGHDPVAYFTDSKPMLGDPRYEYEWDGAIYWFVSAQHRELFVADPERYTPQFSGYCTASLSRGQKVLADPKIWLIQDGRLHLFSAPAGPKLMRQDPSGMVAAAQHHFETGHE